jgi:hypothetical protein
MNTSKNTMKSSKNQSRSQKTQESSQPSNRDHQCPQGEAKTEPSPYMTRKNFEALKAASQWRGVFCDGPIAHKPTEEAEEVPTWIVFIGTKEREPVSKTYLCHSIERAKNLAGVMARDRGMELIDEATTA